MIDTAPFIHRCVPTIGSVSAVFDAINSDGTFTTILSDLTATWREVLYLCVVALGEFVELLEERKKKPAFSVFKDMEAERGAVGWAE